MLLDKSVKFFGPASIIGSNLQSGLDADISDDIDGDDVLHADDMLCDLDRVKTEASSADSVVELGSKPLIGYDHTEVRKL